MIFKKHLLLTLIFLVSISVNAQWWGSKKVKGNGVVISKERKIDNFEKLTLLSFFNVELREGNESKVVVNAEENLIPFIKTVVDNEKLKIFIQKKIKIKNTEPVKVIVYYKNIEKIDLLGSGSIISKKRLDSDELKIDLSGSGSIFLEVELNELQINLTGSGDVDLEGKTDVLECKLSGSGSLESFDLETKYLEVKIVGSGGVNAYVKKQIKANITGSGDLKYKGKPNKIKSKIVGSGNLIDVN